MALWGARNTIVGFSAQLDWRPMNFVKPIPSSWICGACGLVRPVSAHLPCQHVLCESCYEQSAQGELTRVCPLDGLQCLDEEVNMEEITGDALLQSQVRCWNESAGCDYVMAASNVSDHFHNECFYHSTLCPKCSASVLCSKVYAHLISDCSASLLSTSPQDGRGSDKRSEAVALEDCKKLLHQRMAGIKAELDKILNDQAVHKQTLSEILTGIGALKEKEFVETPQHGRRMFGRSPGKFDGAAAVEVDSSSSLSEPPREVCGRIRKLEELVKQELKSVANQIRCDIASNTTKILVMHSELILANRGMLVDNEMMIAQTSLERNVYQFTVEGISDMWSDVVSTGSASFMAVDEVYLRGYFMSPGVRFLRCRSSATLHPWINLHWGQYDESLDWPMGMGLTLSAIHPHTAEDRPLDFVCPVSDIVSGPMPPQNQPIWPILPEACLLSGLQSDGFVNDDCLLLKYKLVSQGSSGY